MSKKDKAAVPNKKQTYYHYTTATFAEKIMKSGSINKSDVTRGDAVYGNGVYLTQKPPDSGKLNIAINNYDGFNPKVAERAVAAG